MSNSYQPGPTQEAGQADDAPGRDGPSTRQGRFRRHVLPGVLVAVLLASASVLGALRHGADQARSNSTDGGSAASTAAQPGGPPRPSTAAPSALSPAASTLYDPALRTIAMQLVSSAENSSLDWQAQYGYIEWNVEGVPDENRGYTAGLVGFCSGCGDMTQVVSYYTSLAPTNELAKYLPALRRQQQLGMGHVTQGGLGPSFVRDWRAAAHDPLFRQAQDHEVDIEYLHPAVDQAITDGLRPLGQFIYYDAIVMHGSGNGPTSFGGIRAAALRKAAPPARGGDETSYLTAFLNARTVAMRAEKGHNDTSRVDDEQRRFLANGNFDLHLPLHWSTYGDRYDLPAS
jgi:chitosanase